MTFYGCRFHGAGDLLCPLFGDNIIFHYCSFEPGVSAPPVSYAEGYQYGIEANGSYNSYVGQLTVTHCDIWGFGNAIDASGATQQKPHYFAYNWIHDARADGGKDHTDGIGELSGGGATMSYVTIHHNTIESVGNTQGIAYQAGRYSNFIITDNLIGGWNTAIAVGDVRGKRPSNIIFSGNTFSTRLPIGFRPLYNAFWTSPGSVWANNKWKVPFGAAWGNPAHDGWYWIPNTKNYAGNDLIYVSPTDYSR